ncbi:MAG TPA: FkbM family methyltransferase [Caulobacteraceae bacterium]
MRLLGLRLGGARRPEPGPEASRTEFSLRQSLERLRDNGFRPQTIFDIGVATGTTGLYKVFPGARYMLVDPLEESEPFMKSICARVPLARYVVAAAMDQPGETSIAVHPGLSGSGALLKGDFPHRPVKAVTLDQLIEEHQLEGPFLVKVDVQGSELQVLDGLQAHLDQAEVIVLEASLWADRKKWGAPTFADIIQYMARRRFVLYDLASIGYRQRDRAIAEMDLVFVRFDHPIRRHKGHRSPDAVADLVEHKRGKFADPNKPNL